MDNNKTTIEVDGSVRMRVNRMKYTFGAKTHNETMKRILDIVEKIQENKK